MVGLPLLCRRLVCAVSSRLLSAATAVAFSCAVSGRMSGRQAAENSVGVNVSAQKASKLQPKQMNVFGLCYNICPNGHSGH